MSALLRYLNLTENHVITENYFPLNIQENCIVYTSEHGQVGPYDWVLDSKFESGCKLHRPIICPKISMEHSVYSLLWDKCACLLSCFSHDCLQPHGL